MIIGKKTSAAGKFPGGFFKREGRPSEKEILTMRLIDRPLRPLFPDKMGQEIQVLTTVFSADDDNDPDILAMNAAFAAVSISDIPFDGPAAAVRVVRVDGELVCNPTYEQIDLGDMNLIVAGTKDSIVMVEGGTNMVSETDLLGALKFAHDNIKQIITMIDELVEKTGKPKIEFEVSEINSELESQVRDLVSADLQKINLEIQDKNERSKSVKSVFESALEELFSEEDPEAEQKTKDIIEVCGIVEKEILRRDILEYDRRADGRKHDEIRPIECEVGLIPKAHGSSLFTRGQTQALVTATLGTASDEQSMDSLVNQWSKNFMLHYNFPPYSVGEVRPIRGVGRREIGHGALAERALKPVIPNDDNFPYTLRIVSDIMESNGSSSMASVCGGSLALMDAGVPIPTAVAGIAMGLVIEGDKYRILSDILGVEDHLGDMDFKVTGTKDGITAFQMDIKIGGVSMEILAEALEQAKVGRLHILGIMNETISEARAELADNAPRINIIEIPLDKIGDVIGPGGKIIRGITASTGAKIDIDDSGTVGKVMIASSNAEAMDKAVEMVKYYTEEVEMGKLYLGKVARIMGFGAFVEILPGKEGMVHISQLAESRVEDVEDVVKIHDEIWVKVMEIDDQGRVNLSHKLALREMRGEPFDESDYQPRAGGGKSRDSRGGRNDRGGRGRNDRRRR